MLNSTSNSKVEIKTTATGIIQRSSNESYFLRFHHNSSMAERLFTKKPSYDGKPVSVIQMLLIEQGYILAEIIDQN
jgi:hypothetical protein